MGVAWQRVILKKLLAKPGFNLKAKPLVSQGPCLSSSSPGGGRERDSRVHLWDPRSLPRFLQE